MKKTIRAIALLLCVCVCAQLTGCVMPADPPPWWDASSDSRSFPDSPQTEEQPDAAIELTYTPFDGQSFVDALDTARARWQQPDQESAVIEDYYALVAAFVECLTAYKVSEVLYYTDYTNEELRQANADAYTTANDCSDAINLFLSDLLKSDYRSTYIREVGRENALMYENYQPLTQEQKDLMEQENALQDRYAQLAGGQYDDHTALAAAVAPVYLELIQVRNDLARSFGYDDYPTYAYECIYVRSYTPQDADKLGDRVKKELAPLYVDCLLAESEADYDAFYRYDRADEAHLLELLGQYIGGLAPTLQESLDHMLATGSYSIAHDKQKFDVSFTTMLNGLRTPYLFTQPQPDSQVYSFTTLVHEFGHYHNYLNDPTYSVPDGLMYALDDIDVAEISSTGLELLLLQDYPQLYGDDAATLQRSVLGDLLSNVVYGCMLDEFQQIVYTTPDLTAEALDDICYQVVLEYMGDIYYEDYARTLWAQIYHNFEAPFYYISYCMSALASFQLWQLAQTDFDAALQQYLDIAALGCNVDFLWLVEECGMQDVLSLRYLSDLYDRLEPVLTR